jgi:hypothetical protein
MGYAWFEDTGMRTFTQGPYTSGRHHLTLLANVQNLVPAQG